MFLLDNHSSHLLHFILLILDFGLSGIVFSLLSSSLSIKSKHEDHFSDELESTDEVLFLDESESTDEVESIDEEFFLDGGTQTETNLPSISLSFCLFDFTSFFSK